MSPRKLHHKLCLAHADCRRGWRVALPFLIAVYQAFPRLGRMWLITSTKGLVPCPSYHTNAMGLCRCPRTLLTQLTITATVEAEEHVRVL